MKNESSQNLKVSEDWEHRRSSEAAVTEVSCEMDSPPSSAVDETEVPLFSRINEARVALTVGRLVCFNTRFQTPFSMPSVTLSWFRGLLGSGVSSCTCPNCEASLLRLGDSACVILASDVEIVPSRLARSPIICTSR